MCVRMRRGVEMSTQLFYMVRALGLRHGDAEHKHAHDGAILRRIRSRGGFIVVTRCQDLIRLEWSANRVSLVYVQTFCYILDMSYGCNGSPTVFLYNYGHTSSSVYDPVSSNAAVVSNAPKGNGIGATGS